MTCTLLDTILSTSRYRRTAVRGLCLWRFVTPRALLPPAPPPGRPETPRAPFPNHSTPTKRLPAKSPPDLEARICTVFVKY